MICLVLIVGIRRTYLSNNDEYGLHTSHAEVGSLLVTRGTCGTLAREDIKNNRPVGRGIAKSARRSIDEDRAAVRRHAVACGWSMDGGMDDDGAGERERQASIGQANVVRVCTFMNMTKDVIPWPDTSLDLFQQVLEEEIRGEPVTLWRPMIMLAVRVVVPQRSYLTANSKTIGTCISVTERWAYSRHSMVSWNVSLARNSLRIYQSHPTHHESPRYRHPLVFCATLVESPENSKESHVTVLPKVSGPNVRVEYVHIPLHEED